MNLGHFEDPQNFVASKIPCLTISCSSLKKGNSLYINKVWQGCGKQYVTGFMKTIHIGTRNEIPIYC